MMIETTGAGIPPVQPVMTAQELLASQALLRRVKPVGERVIDAILRLVGRPAGCELGSWLEQIAWGPGRAPARP